MDQIVVLKAIADESRLEIVKFLIQHGETSCTQISQQFDLSQPTMSHHFRKLQEAGVIVVRKVGIHHLYRVESTVLRAAGLQPKKL